MAARVTVFILCWALRAASANIKAGKITKTCDTLKGTCYSKEKASQWDKVMRCVMCTDLQHGIPDVQRCHSVDNQTICALIRNNRTCVFTSNILAEYKNTTLQKEIENCKMDLDLKQRETRCTMLSRLIKSQDQMLPGDLLWVDGRHDIECTKTTKYGKCGRNIHLAIRSGHQQLMERLVFESPKNINCPCRFKRTLLMNTVFYNKANLFDVLVGLGADLSVVTSFDRNILHIACTLGKTSFVKKLVDLGLDIDKKGIHGVTPLVYALRIGNLDVVDYLLSIGSNVSNIAWTGNSILHEACKCKKLIIPHLLSKNITGLSIEARNNFNNTPVITAIDNGRFNAIEYLISMGCDLTVTDRVGNTILHKAAMRKSLDILKYIVSLKIIQLNCKNKLGETPLMIAKSRRLTSNADFLERIRTSY